MSSDWVPKKFKNINQKGKKVMKTSKVMEELCFVISIAGLNRPTVVKDDDDNDKPSAPLW
jgi:hypothetical protein